jgi:glycosyltransferase involved in cell wall biosynthesis
MKFSILIPTLNEESHIGELLDCLAFQKYKNFDVVIVDGNSVDKTEDVIKKYSKKLDIKFKKTGRRNISYQRNLAAKLSKNNNLVFFDADIKVDKDFLNKLRKEKVIKRFNIATSWNIPQSQNVFDHIFFFIVNFFVLELRSKFSPGAIGTFIFSEKKVFQEVGGFDEEVVLGEDFDLFQRIHKKRKYKISILREPKIYTCMRRYKKEGRLNLISRYVAMVIYYLLKGPIKDPEIFKYQKGRH